MMKRSFIVILLLTLLFLTGCGAASADENNAEETLKEEIAGLVLIDHDENEGLQSYIMYDPETLVMYVLVRDGHNSAAVSGFSVMLNADGSPRLFFPS